MSHQAITIYVDSEESNAAEEMAESLARRLGRGVTWATKHDSPDKIRSKIQIMEDGGVFFVEGIDEMTWLARSALRETFETLAAHGFSVDPSILSQRSARGMAGQESRPLESFSGWSRSSSVPRWKSFRAHSIYRH